MSPDVQYQMITGLARGRLPDSATGARRGSGWRDRLAVAIARLALRALGIGLLRDLFRRREQRFRDGTLASALTAEVERLGTASQFAGVSAVRAVEPGMHEQAPAGSAGLLQREMAVRADLEVLLQRPPALGARRHGVQL